eukprot:TRINITY_DN3373_c0_g1_i3.p1 TRINITY_DN3373_c0_g1~~TRINITY_DN3373_c0_g1_i3.p1  ORF type:complete len:220 (+),score=71.40 TRINITY_DN3373_c0_g1_i3:104-763(+)
MCIRDRYQRRVRGAAAAIMVLSSELVVALAPAYFKALLHGLIRQHFYAEPGITHQYLKDQIFSDKPAEYPDDSWPPPDTMLESLFNEYVSFLGHAAVENWSHTHVDALLTAEEFPVVQREVLVALWKSEEEKIHQTLVEGSSWQPSLNQVEWRVDRKVASNHSDQSINKPCAIVELSFSAGADSATKLAPARFELDSEELGAVNAKFDKINDLIASLAE